MWSCFDNAPVSAGDNQTTDSFKIYLHFLDLTAVLPQKGQHSRDLNPDCGWPGCREARGPDYRLVSFFDSTGDTPQFIAGQR